MNVLIWIVLGLVAGFIAKFLMPGKDGGGLISTILLGVAGSFLGGFVGQNLLNFKAEPGLNLYSIGTAVAGALVLLLLKRVISSRKRK